jgi:hypothetical protein
MQAAVTRIAGKSGFVWDPTIQPHQTPVSTEFGTLLGPVGTGLRMYLSSYRGNFGVVIGDPSTGNEFSDSQKSLIRKVESDLRAEFPGQFTECHLNFKSRDNVCAIDGGL